MSISPRTSRASPRERRPGPRVGSLRLTSGRCPTLVSEQSLPPPAAVGGRRSLAAAADPLPDVLDRPPGERGERRRLILGAFADRRAVPLPGLARRVPQECVAQHVAALVVGAVGRFLEDEVV